jgi:hypothetical protein
MNAGAEASGEIRSLRTGLAPLQALTVSIPQWNVPPEAPPQMQDIHW